jgi:hypothetical protein
MIDEVYEMKKGKAEIEVLKCGILSSRQKGGLNVRSIASTVGC